MTEIMTSKVTSKAEEVMDKINASMAKKFKKNAPELMLASDLSPISWVSTGLLGYDYLNGGGGPRGRVEMIWGIESSGKTTVSLKRIAAAQQAGLVCAFIDLEHDLDRVWATKLGVDLEKLILHEPVYEPAEMTLALVEELIESDVDLIVLDSVPALCTEAKMKGEVGDKHYAGVSALMTQFYERNIGGGTIYNNNTLIIMINQPRDLIGARFPTSRLPGGRALRHMCSIITEVKRGDYITIGPKESEVKIGIEVNLINRKNKVRWPYREQTLRLQYANGFNPLWDVIQFAKKYDLVEVSGSWMHYEGQNMGNGVEQVMAWLADNANVYIELKTKIVDLIKKGQR